MLNREDRTTLNQELYDEVRGLGRAVANRDDSGMLRVRAGVCFYNQRRPVKSAAQCRAAVAKFEEIL